MTNSWGQPPEDVIPLRRPGGEGGSWPPAGTVWAPDGGLWIQSEEGWCRWNGERWELTTRGVGAAPLMQPASEAVAPGGSLRRRTRGRNARALTR